MRPVARATKKWRANAFRVMFLGSHTRNGRSPTPLSTHTHVT